MGWFEEQNVPGYQTGAYEQGGITGGGVTVDQPAAEPAAPTFNLDGAMVHGRKADTRNFTDLMTLVQRQPGFDISTNEAAQKTFTNIVKPFLAQQGITDARLTGNNFGKITAGGKTIDWIANAGSTTQARHAQALEGSSGGSKGKASAAAPAPGGAFSAAIGGGSGVPGPGGGGYTPPAFDPFKYEAFDPNSVNMATDPGVAFRIKEATRAMEHGAAAKGTLLSGGFQKALTDRIGDASSMEYGNAFNRALTTNQANNAGRLGGFNANTGASLGYGNLALGHKSADNQFTIGQGQLALGHKTADQGYDLGLRNNALGYTQAGNAYSLGNQQIGLGWANYGLNADGQNFDQGYKLSTMGQNGAAQLGSYGSSYGNAAGGYMTGAGNAQAAGQVGAANAWGQAFQNGANNAAAAYYYGQGRD